MLSNHADMQVGNPAHNQEDLGFLPCNCTALYESSLYHKAHTALYRVFGPPALQKTGQTFSYRHLSTMSACEVL